MKTIYTQASSLPSKQTRVKEHAKNGASKRAVGGGGGGGLPSPPLLSFLGCRSILRGAQTKSPVPHRSLVFLDQFRFLGNCPPTPPLTQHFALSAEVLMLA